MKYASSFLIIILLYPAAFAQNYHPLIKENKNWDVMTIHFTGCGYSGGGRFIFDGDTVINNYTYQILKHYPILGSSQFCPPYVVDTSQYFIHGYMREDTINKEIYILMNNADMLLYDFKVIPGDTLPHYGFGQYLVVDSVSTTTLITNEQRKIVYLNSGEYFIEEIGGSQGVAWPLIQGIGFDHDVFCVSENNVTLWKELMFGPGCIPLVNINEVYMNEKIKIFPNPTSGIFSIDVKNLGNMNITINNILGELIYSSQKGHFSLLQIDLSNENPGIYFCKINSGDQYFVAKIIKQ